jgi:hypothetical protein
LDMSPPMRAFLRENFRLPFRVMVGDIAIIAPILWVSNPITSTISSKKEEG